MSSGTVPRSASARVVAWPSVLAHHVTPRLAIGILSVTTGLLVWQWLTSAGHVSELLFSSPSAVVTESVHQFSSSLFWTSASNSAIEFLGGFVAAVVLGIPLGLLIGWFRDIGYFVDPWLSFFYAVPRIAMTPLLIIMFGISQTTIIAVIFLGAIFEITFNTAQGARLVDRKLVDVAQMFGASRQKIFVGIVVPSSVPFILVGCRLGVVRAIIGVVIGEMFAGGFADGAGLGQMLRLASNSLQTSRVLLITMCFALMAVIVTEGLRYVERRLGVWRNDIGGAQ